MELAQERGLQFYQTRSLAVVLHNTLPAACTEKAVCMKTTDELYQKVRFNSESATSCVNIELAAWSARSSKPQTHDHLANHQMTRTVTGKPVTAPWTTESAGVPLSAVEPQKTTRENNVQRLTEKFENHKNKNSFILDLRQTGQINKFSQESQDRDLRTLRNIFQTAMSLTAMPAGKWE